MTRILNHPFCRRGLLIEKTIRFMVACELPKQKAGVFSEFMESVKEKALTALYNVGMSSLKNN
jgi:hypothetical protein